MVNHLVYASSDRAWTVSKCAGANSQRPGDVTQPVDLPYIRGPPLLGSLEPNPVSSMRLVVVNTSSDPTSHACSMCEVRADSTQKFWSEHMSAMIKRAAAIIFVPALAMSGAAGAASATTVGSIGADSLGSADSGTEEENSGESSLVLDLGSVIPSLNLGSDIENLNVGSDIENILS